MRLHVMTLLSVLICFGCSQNAPVAPATPSPVASAPVVATPVDELPEKIAPAKLADPPIADKEPPAAVAEEPAAELPKELEAPFTLEDGFTLLTMNDFDAFGAESETWVGQDDEILCTGKPKGYLYSQNTYQNFTWRLEYRFERPKSLKDESKFKGNTGFLVYITGELKAPWPVCLEVQGKQVQMAAIKENGGAAPVTVEDDEAARQAARRPVGKWNRLEIVSRDGALNVKLNDVPISRSEPNFLSEGKIGIQAEDHPFTVRRMRIGP